MKQIPEDQLVRKILHADGRHKRNHKEENLLVLHREQFPLKKRNWIDFELEKYSLSAYEVSMKVTFLRHLQQMHREEDAAIHFWTSKENLENQFP